MKAFVYFNLHTHLWSVKALDGQYKGKVVAHARSIELHDCELKVSEAGRQRVIREQAKNVHAGVVGEVVAIDAVSKRYPVQFHRLFDEVDDVTRLLPVTYNPYRFNSFVTKDKHIPVHRADKAVLNSTGLHIGGH